MTSVVFDLDAFLLRVQNEETALMFVVPFMFVQYISILFTGEEKKGVKLIQFHRSLIDSVISVICFVNFCLQIDCISSHAGKEIRNS